MSLLVTYVYCRLLLLCKFHAQLIIITYLYRIHASLPSSLGYVLLLSKPPRWPRSLLFWTFLLFGSGRRGWLHSRVKIETSFHSPAASKTICVAWSHLLPTPSMCTVYVAAAEAWAVGQLNGQHQKRRSLEPKVLSSWRARAAPLEEGMEDEWLKYKMGSGYRSKPATL